MEASEYAAALSDVAGRREACAVAVVTRTEGSTLAKPGFKIVIAGDGSVLGGTLGGGCPEGPIVEAALRAIRAREPRVLRVHLVDAAKAVSGTVGNPDENEIYVETNCGGTLEVYVEPMLPSERIVVVGQGGKDDVEDAVVAFGKALGFQVLVVDPAPFLRESPDRIVEDAEVDPKALSLGAADYVVVLTKGERDVAVLRALSAAGTKFVGLLASRHRLRKNLEELRAAGVPEPFLRGLHAPIGLDIGAKTPAELAIAILADIVATKYGKDIPHKPLDG